MNIYFSDFFSVDPKCIESYGAFNISLINDLPLFIDPFLLFGSQKEEYKLLHDSILEYLMFLKEKSEQGISNPAQVKSWYLFPEVKQNWFGYSKVGNRGSGLGANFGKAFSSSMHIVFDDLGNEQVTQSSHLEKAALFEIGVGKDNVSDFTTNLIKKYLLEYTQKFAQQYIDSKYIKRINVDKVYFDYAFERWMPKQYDLPYIYDDYVLLTPKDILTKDENWINSNDLRADFTDICNSIQNDQLKHEILNYFQKVLPKKEKNKRNSQKEITEAIQLTIKKYPSIIKWYVKSKEENKNGAKALSDQKVKEVEDVFIKNISWFVDLLSKESDFYEVPANCDYLNALKRISCFKTIVEEFEGYKLFYVDNHQLKREADLQIIYRLIWHASELIDGTEEVDISESSTGKKQIVEFKLASNSKLKHYLKKRFTDDHSDDYVVVVFYYNGFEYKKITEDLKELNLDNSENIILIDAGYSMIEETQNTIYFSYAWGDNEEKGISREQVINELYDTLKSKSYKLQRDKMDIGYKGLISEFMGKIGEGDVIIVAISEKYLKSTYCMFELYEIFRNSKLDKQSFVDKIFPIRVENIDMKNPDVLDEYFEYWETKEKKWEDFIQRRTGKVGKEQFDEYDKVKKIGSHIGDLSSFIMDINSLTVELLSENNFKTILEAIDKKIGR